MNGLDKIKDQILNEANSAAGEMVTQAKEEAKAILQKAEDEAKTEGKKLAEKSKVQIENQRERFQSGMELQRKQAILSAKQDVIAEILDSAYEKLLNQEDAGYFEMVLKMVEKFALPQEGSIVFSTKDLGRMPSGFEADINQAAQKKGGSLELEKDGRNMEGGFVLVYGGIEENCTLKAMFHSAKDDLSDQVHKLLFA
ncbi:MAG: V-type ATP synthase subunit E family protein [Hespellia sp.]|nr:V-type ATP synthase subunit E family protein [Hespellia sp.]